MQSNLPTPNMIELVKINFVMVIITAVTDPIEASVLNDTDTSNPVLFTLMGRTALRTAYGHLVVPLKVTELMATFDKVSDMMSALNFARAWTPETFAHRQFSLELLRKKIDLLHHLANDVGEKTHFEELNDSNEVNVTLLERLGDNIRQWRPATVAPTSTARPTRGGRKRRDANAGDVTYHSLASFGLDLFPLNVLKDIYVESQKSEDENQKYVTRLPQLNVVRISALKAQVATVYRMVHETVRGAINLVSQDTRKAIEEEINIITDQLQQEVDFFLTGIDTLVRRKFSPILINPDNLQTEYGNLLTKARAHDLRPVSEDAGIIFQSETSIIGTSRGDLICVIHVPLYQGNLMNLYRYINAPFLIHRNIVATIKSEKEFLALDTSGTLGKELSLEDLTACKEVNRIHHCGSENVLQKNLDDLCLYNLYHQRVDDIENRCRVELSRLRSHAIQLSGSQFRILVTVPTQLTWNCIDGSTQVDTIDGVYLLTLTEKCPKATTPDHLFVRNPDILPAQQMIALPLVQQATEWFDSLGAGFEDVDLDEVFDELFYHDNKPITIQAFRNHLLNHSFEHVKEYVNYGQLGLSGVVAAGLVYFSLKWLSDTLLKNCKKGFRKRAPRPSKRNTKPTSRVNSIFAKRYLVPSASQEQEEVRLEPL